MQALLRCQIALLAVATALPACAQQTIGAAPETPTPSAVTYPIPTGATYLRTELLPSGGARVYYSLPAPGGGLLPDLGRILPPGAPPLPPEQLISFAPVRASRPNIPYGDTNAGRGE